MDVSSLLTVVTNILALITWPFICPSPWSELSFLIAKHVTKFDFIIVGGGSAGSVLANRLSENSSVNVLLLEAGDCPPVITYVPGTSIFAIGTNADWYFLVQPQNNSFLSYPNNQPRYPQGKMLGGSSGINAMMYVRGNKDDYDLWESLGNPGWGYNDCLPYFKKAEGNTIPAQMADAKYHNTSGPLTVSYAPYSTRAFQTFIQSVKLIGEYIADINAESQIGLTQIPFTISNGTRWSTFAAYLSPVMLRPNLFVLTNAQVTKILTNSAKQATGVEYTRFGLPTRYTVEGTKEVILSAGALNSPKVLMLSGIGPANQLKQNNIPLVANLSGVGQNLQDHVGCWGLIWKVNCTDCTYRVEDVLSATSALDFVLSRKGPLTLWGGNEGVGFLKSKYVNANITKPDYQIQFATVNPGQSVDTFVQFSGMSKDVVNQYYAPLANESTFITIVNNEDVKSRGTVTLKSRDPFQPPVIDFKFLSEPIDVDVLVDGMKHAVALINTSPFQKLGAQLNPTILKGCENLNQDSDAFYECLIRHLSFIAYHPAGTCQMGPSTNLMSVVNSNLEVYGVPGLRVIDASIMPVLTTGNTNAPVIMIAEKMSDAIKNKYGI